MKITPLNLQDYNYIIFFTGAGMSAESGVPTYRGSGGLWHEYRWEDYACQEAWELNPDKVFNFHDERRKEALKCDPHDGHEVIAWLEQNHSGVSVVTQNIDGMHQRAGSRNVIELHGSIWRVRCEEERVVHEDMNPGPFASRKCDCSAWLRPDIIWFSDYLNPETLRQADDVISRADLFISIGTSGVVWPAAGYPQLAKSGGAKLIEINPEPSEQSHLYDHVYPDNAGKVLPKLFDHSTLKTT